MQSYHFPRLTLPDDIGEVSAQHPITLERLREINATAVLPVKRRRSLPSTHRNISMAEPAAGHPDIMAPPQEQTPFDMESFLSEEERQFLVKMGVVSPFVSHIMKSLNEILAGIVRSNIAEGASIAEITDVHRFQVKEASHAIRNIYSAWSKYPRAGGSLEGAVIESIDYRYSATNAIEGGPESLPSKIAIFMANKIDPKDIEFQTVVHEQRRIDDCRNAMERTYGIWQTRLDPPRSLSDDALLVELTSESTSPITYTMQPPRPNASNMTKPSTPAEMMSSAALVEQAEYEMHDNVHIFVGGGKVLKNQAEKRSDLAQQLDVRKAEAKEAKEAKKAKKAQEAADALAASKAKGRGEKKPVVVSSSDHDDVDEQLAPKPGRKTTKTTTRKRPVDDMDVDDDATVARKSTKTTGRKRSAAEVEENDDDADTPTKAPAPRKKAKKTASKDASNDGISEKPSGDSNDGDSGAPPTTQAPENAKRGGAAPKWLRDEDNLGRQLVMGNPLWPMPQVYQEFNRRIANTAYQTDKMETHDYRADWIEFPRIDANGRSINDKAARKFDISWRTYESVRQHLEKHKARVNDPDEVKPFTWTQITENPVVYLPKRDPPPRPTYFKDGTTLVPQLEDESSAEEDTSVEDASSSDVQDKQSENNTGWKPINKTFGRTSSPMDSSSAPAHKKRPAPKEKAKISKALPQINTSEYANPLVFMQPETPEDPGHLRSAPGDELYEDLAGFVQDQSDGEEDDDLEAFVRNQSDGEEDDDEETVQVQLNGPADGNQPSRAPYGAPSRRPTASRLPPASVSQDQGLPSGWTQRNTTQPGHNYGRPYYLDHNRQRTTWLDPTTPGFDQARAFQGPNADSPRYPRDHVWVGDQFVSMEAAGLASRGPGSSYRDLAIANLPAPETGSSPPPRASAPGRRSAATSGGTAATRATPRRTSASAPTATSASASRPSKVVKLQIKGRFPADKKSKDDKESEDSGMIDRKEH